MVNCLQLYRNTDGEWEDALTIDRLMCEHFNAPYDEERYFNNWYGTIGISLAYGHTFNEIIVEAQADLNQSLRRQRAQDASYFKLKMLIAEWLQKNYTYEGNN